ncbi:N-acetylmuramoyl-L-alanine amidase [Alphaproteobacteria bacterium]|nr:N-acetylmuramoyl-L-alanine amidase [Alphaproteobacteria bacterium]
MTIHQLNCNLKFLQCYQEFTGIRKINFILLHHIQANNIQNALDQLYDHKVSSHYLIDDDGNIFQLIDDNDIAYHAGTSYWQGIDGLNKHSIGIEILSTDPFNKGFNNLQMQATIELSHKLMIKHKINNRNILGHSDVAYYKDTGFLDRKQDPSHLFDWNLLAQNGIGIFPKINLSHHDDKILFFINDQNPEIAKIKLRLKNLGYKVSNINNYYNQEMQVLARVFNRHYNPLKYHENSDFWYMSSQFILERLINL